MRQDPFRRLVLSSFWPPAASPGNRKGSSAGASDAVTQATIRRIVNGDGALFPMDQAALMPKIAAPCKSSTSIAAIT